MKLIVTANISKGSEPVFMFGPGERVTRAKILKAVAQRRKERECQKKT
jgi:hypothetical protein